MKYFTLAASLLLLISCQKKAEKTENVNDTTAVVTDTVAGKPNKDGEYCFRKVVKKDSIILNFTRTGDNVKGIFHWKPYEKDKKIATFEGTMDGATATAIGSYLAEGSSFKEELVFILDDNDQALIKFGE